MHISTPGSPGRSGRRAVASIATAALIGSTVIAASTAPATAATAVRPDVVELTIAQTTKLLSSGKTTSAALVKEYLARIAAYDGDTTTTPGLHAVIASNSAAAADAIALDKERAAGKVRGPLHGVPIVVKDNIDLLGMPTTNGAIAFATYKPKNDSTVVKKLRAAGAIIIAKTNLSEFAWSGSDAKSGLGGEVRNPYNRAKTSSGSSGGTASAVAASYATAGLGTDTYGSIRNPSGNQGLVGVRPTHGLVSLTGVTAQISPLDTVGPMTKSVEDAAIILDAIAGYDPSDPYTKKTIGKVPESYVDELSTKSLQGKKILTFTNARFHGGTNTNRPEERAEVAGIQAAALAEMEEQGATVEEVELTPEQITSISGRGWVGFGHYLDEFFAGNDAVWPKGLAAKAEPIDELTTADYVADGRYTDQIAPDASWLLSTVDVTQQTLDTQQAREASARAAWKDLLNGYDADAVALPNDTLAASDVTADPAGYSESSTNAGYASGLGVPAIAVPVGQTAAGLPVSVQLIGALWSEADLLSYAYDYEQATHLRKAPKTTPELSHPKAMTVTTKVKGTRKVGRTLVATAKTRSGSSTVTGAKVIYRWTAAGKYVGKARSLRLTKKMVGKKIRVRVTVSKSGYITASRTHLVGKVRKR
ncbi:amidase [Aeromicrobium sp. P5_D10]